MEISFLFLCTLSIANQRKMKVAGKKRRVTETEVKQQLVDGHSLDGKSFGIVLKSVLLLICASLTIVTSEGSKPTFFFCNR